MLNVPFPSIKNVLECLYVNNKEIHDVVRYSVAKSKGWQRQIMRSCTPGNSQIFRRKCLWKESAVHETNTFPTVQRKTCKNDDCLDSYNYGCFLRSKCCLNFYSWNSQSIEEVQFVDDLPGKKEIVFFHEITTVTKNIRNDDFRCCVL